MEHYSERFKRNFADGDWLTTREAQAVLAANSEKQINVEYVSYIAKRENVKTMQIENKRFYLYDGIKNLNVKLKRGPSGSPSPSPVAQRQRAWRARQKEKRKAQAE